MSKNGDYKLGDFGIAKTVEKTSGGTKIGTYKYMAPEVYNNQLYNLTADIYSLGLVLHWMLNERRSPFMPLPPAPVVASQEDEARSKRFSGTSIPAPSHGNEELKRIVLKACAYNPKDRYQSAEDMLADLKKQGGKDRLMRNETDYRPVGWHPHRNDREFALKGAKFKRTIAATGGEKHVVFMAFSSANARIPVRYMLFDGPSIEYEHICTSTNCIDHPNDYWGTKVKKLDTSELRIIETAIDRFIEEIKNNEGNFIVAELYFEAIYSDGERITINNIHCNSELSYDERLHQLFKFSHITEVFSNTIEDIISSKVSIQSPAPKGQELCKK